MNHVFTHLFQPEKKVYSLLKSVLGLLMFFLFLPAWAQKAPSNFVTTKVGVTPLSYTLFGYGPNSGTNYYTDVEFNLNFGKENAANNGFNREISSFQVEGRTYVRGEQGNTPFTKVVLKRIDNSVTGKKATAFFEVAEDPADNTLYLAPDYVNTVEGLINSYVFNRGSDNVFSNNQQTHNNVERIDLIFENGIKAPSNAAMLNRSGILVMERGGNDSFKFALIKTLSGGADKQVTGLGELKTASQATAWGGTDVSFKSVVFQRNDDEAETGKLKPSQLLGSQMVYGTFISLQDLGVGPDEMFYGISLFANDVTSVGSGQNLVDLSEGFPTTTDGTSDGGLDFMAGGGFFMLANNVGGRVFHDAAPDPSAINGHTGGQDGSLVNALDLYVSLTDMSGNVLQTVAVENGSYTFYDVADGNYKVVLHETAGGSATSDFPDGWFGTGEGANGIKDGTIDGSISLSVPATGSSNLIMNNFGINKEDILPIEANDDDFGTITSTVAYTTPEAIFVNDKLGDDPVDPAKVTLKVDGAEVTAAVPLKEGTVGGPAATGVKLNPDGTVTVDAGTPPGTYTLEYTICEIENPDNCDDAVIVIKVKEETQIDADDDDFGTVSSTVAYTTPETIFVNDTLNNVPVDPSLVTLKVGGAEVTAAVPLKEGTVSGPDASGVKLNPDGTVTVDAGTPPGTYTLEYTICEDVNPDNCDDAVIVIKVGAFDLALKKEIKAGQKAVFKEGDEVTFVITVTNEGTVDATDVEVVDYVPEGLELVGTDWVITDGKAKRATPIASLPAGEEISLEITFKVTSDAKPTIRNAAEISSAKGGTDTDSTFDEDRNNDEDGEDDFDTSVITICKKGGNCLPVKTTKIR